MEQRLHTAKVEGYSQQFHLFKSGQVLSSPSWEIFDYEEFFDPEKEDSCSQCGDKLLYLTTIYGTKGVLVKSIED